MAKETEKKKYKRRVSHSVQDWLAQPQYNCPFYFSIEIFFHFRALPPRKNTIPAKNNWKPCWEIGNNAALNNEKKIPPQAGFSMRI